MKSTVFLLVSFLLIAGCEPIGPVPGGRLAGELGPAVLADWEAYSSLEHAQLETRPTDPHSVNTWFGTIGADLYVPTSMIRGPKSPAERGWVTHVLEDPAVRVRLGNTLFDRVAVRVTGAEYDRARALLEAKYGIDPADRDPEREVWIFRMDARSG